MKSPALALTTAALIATAALALTGCTTPASPTSGGSSSDTSAPSPTAHAQVPTETTVLTSGWAKTGELDGMSGVFGTLANHGSRDLTITRVSSPAAGMTELHEVTSDGVMREIQGPVIVKAGAALEFAPGATHVMLMQLQRVLLPGDEVEVTFTFDDGSTTHVAVLVKDFAGANENYAGEGMDGHSGSH